MHQRLRLEQIWELDGHSRPIFDPQICTRGLISTSFRSSRIEGRDRAGALRALQPRPYFEQPRPTARNSILRALKNLPEKMHQRPHLEQIWELGGHRPIFDPQICTRSPISGARGSRGTIGLGSGAFEDRGPGGRSWREIGSPRRCRSTFDARRSREADPSRNCEVFVAFTRARSKSSKNARNPRELESDVEKATRGASREEKPLSERSLLKGRRVQKG